MRVSFWDIVWPAPLQEISGFNPHELVKLSQYLANYIQKNREYLVYFKERVQERIAPNYRQIIPQEMWFDLLLQRLNNKYYRS